MKLSLAVVAIATIIIIAACSDSKPKAVQYPGDPVNQQEAQTGMKWRVKLTSECPNLKEEECPGRYGFTVGSDRSFIVGPGPAGQKIDGFIEAEEFEQIALLVSDINDDSLADECTSVSGIEVNESISIDHNGNEKVFIRQGSENFCYNSISLDAAATIYKTLKDLVKKYYPIPFPDACIESVYGMQEIIRPIRSCSSDSDCVYVDNTFGAVSNNELQFITTDDCSLIRPIIVANAILLESKQLDIIAARNTAREVCGAKLSRINCAGVMGFQSTASTPACVENTCRISANSRAL